MSSSTPESLTTIYVPLRLTYGLIPIVAGLDKFFNILTDWAAYMPRGMVEALPVPASTFMGIVGIVEIAVGLAVLTNLTRLGAYVVMVWLILIAAVLIAAGRLDVAVRDLAMAIGAFALGQASALRNEAWLPFARTPAPVSAKGYVDGR